METENGTICVGTGAFIEHNVLVTARHLVFTDDNETLLPLAAKGEYLDLVAEHKDLDLAFLKRKWLGELYLVLSMYIHCRSCLNPVFPPH